MHKKKNLLTRTILFVLMLLNLASPELENVLAQNRQAKSQSAPAVYSVTNTNDSGSGSLRQAILDANANPGADIIAFAIGAPGSQQTIQPLSALPAISDPLTMDGWSQGGAGYTGPPLIELSGALVGNNIVGLNITAGGSTVRGLVINGFTGTNAAGIRLQTGGNNWVYGNYIGTDFAGETRLANQRGIWIDNGSSNNRIGTDANGVDDIAERNVISANIDQNIWIYQPATTDNKIMGNYIGVNASGTAAVGVNNQTVATSGIMVQEASYTVIGTDGNGIGDALEGNVISGNIYNVYLTGTSPNRSHHNRVSGNLIGTDASGTVSVGIQVEGVRVYVTEDNVVGTNGDGVSDELEGNLISGNIDFGVMLQQTGALNNVVAGNKIGTDISGMSAIPNGTGSSPRAGILLGGYGNRIGTNSDGVSDALERNLISGNTNVSTYAIYLNNLSNPDAPPTIIAGNWMGVDATGLAALPNNYGIGGTSYAPTIIRNNVISTHTYAGISTHSSAMLIVGNRIGVGADGVTPLGNGHTGLYLSGNDNIIGGAGPGEDNIIAHNGYSSGNYPNGIRVSATGLRNSIRGNRIYANSQLGIDLLWPAGVNINDDGDPDTGGNNLQNYPTVAFAQGYADGTTVIQGTLNSNPNTTFTLDFYYSSEADPSGYGEGEHYLGTGSVITDGNGDATFDVTLPVTVPPNQFVSATATHADGSTSEFSPAFPAGGVMDVPIQGLIATSTGSGYINDPVTFYASISAGTGVSYEWNLGDGSLAAGAMVEHTYTTPGIYTATVTASNNSSSAQAQTVVSILEPANINGRVWEDLDLDGIQGIGEAGLSGVTVSAVGPAGTIQVTSDAQGRYQILTPEPGLYQVSASASGMTPTTASPVSVPMGADGGTLLDFGLHATPPAGYGIIAGRAWIDLDGSGFPEPHEEPLPGLELYFYGFQIPPQTITTNSDGLFSLLLPSDRTLFLYLSAPGFYPSQRKFEWVWLDADAPLRNLHAPFGRGGTVSGRVVNTSGAGVPNAMLNIAQPYHVTSTDSNGDYAFIEQEPAESKGLGMLPPYPYVNYNGDGFRVFPLPPNSVVFENWLVERRGRLTIHAQQTVGNQSLPVGFIGFRLQGSTVDTLKFTGLNGQAWEDLDAGAYTISVLPEFLPPDTIVAPASRTVVITNGTFANAVFNVAPAQSLAVECRVGGVGFDCMVEVYDTNGSLVRTVQLIASAPATVITDLPPGSYEVVIIPSEPGWPESSSVVTLDGDTHADVGYPYNPSNLQTISGYAYWDRCAPSGVRGNTNYCTETNIPSNNDIPVTLYNAAGAVISTTITAVGAGWDTGYYAFPDLPVGNYRVEISLPGGFVAQSTTSAWRSLDGHASPAQLNFGYTRTENRTLTGYAFYDVNNNGSYDLGWDDPYAGAEIAVSTLAGAPISTHTTASDGSFTVSPITSGEYRVVMTTPDLQLTRIAVVPASGGVPWVQFPLPPNDNRPRAIVFLDSNQDGFPGPTEQRLGGVGVELHSQQCGGIAAPIETKMTNSDGLVLFTNPLNIQAGTNQIQATLAAPPGNPPGCVKIVTANLPPNTAPANPNGTAMPKNSGVPVLLPVYPQGTLLVQAFWDVNGDGAYDSNEPMLSSGSATVGGQTKSYSENGATFVLPEGSYSLSAVPPAGYLISTSLPINVVVGAGATTRKIAARVAGGINGAVIGPDGALGGATVRLTHLATNQTYETMAAYGCAGWCSDAFYQFTNLPNGQYRLSIPNPPPGHILAGEPLVNYTTAGQSVQQNLTLNPLGYLSGFVYLDNNMNGQRDSGEAGGAGYTVALLNDAGLPVQTANPDANGAYLFTDLTAGVRYLPTVDLYVSQAASQSDSLTQAPGWFLPGTQPVQADIGIMQGGAEHSYNTVYGKVKSGGAGVAGIRVGAYRWVNGQGCNQTNPAWEPLQTFSDINGDYKLLTLMVPDNSVYYCIAARQLTGYQQSDTPVTEANFSYMTIGNVIVYNPGYWQREISLTPALAAVSMDTAAVGGTIYWQAFRDDNFNGFWDAGEPELPGVALNGDTSGAIYGLTDGNNTLAITSPDGYVPLYGTEVASWLNGADLNLPALAFRFAGVVAGQAFSDDDGDGRQGMHEKVLPGVGISLSGPAQASATTGNDGRFSLPALPDGEYTLNVTPPAGYVSVPAQTIALNNGGAVSLPLRPIGQLSGAIYHDWDGDGQRSGDEPLESTPLTVSVTGLGEARTALGSFQFWGVADGSYSLIPGWQALQPQQVVISSGIGGTLALPAVPPTVVRGIAWLDSNANGVREPWEAPLAGVSISLDGNQTTVTDHNGRYAFHQVAHGNYALTPYLPTRLQTGYLEVEVGEGRGSAVGIPVTMNLVFPVYLPIIKR